MSSRETKSEDKLAVRRVRNRRSAQESRERKRRHELKLEHMNEELSLENQHLKEQINFLENQNKLITEKYKQIMAMYHSLEQNSSFVEEFHFPTSPLTDHLEILNSFANPDPEANRSFDFLHSLDFLTAMPTPSKFLFPQNDELFFRNESPLVLTSGDDHYSHPSVGNSIQPTSKHRAPR